MRSSPAHDSTASSDTDNVLDLKERTWLPAHVRGDSKAFARLTRAYGPLVMGFLKRYGIAASSRDDLFQDIFLKIHLAAATYRPDQPLRPWLITITLNAVRNARRTIARSPLTESGRDLPDQRPNPDRALDSAARLAIVTDAISTLPDAQREAISLFTLRSLSMREIAQAMQIPENTAKTHLRRARLALATQLTDRMTPRTGGSP